MIHILCGPRHYCLGTVYDLNAVEAAMHRLRGIKNYRVLSRVLSQLDTLGETASALRTGHAPRIPDQANVG